MCPVCPELQVVAAAPGWLCVQGRGGKWCVAFSTGHLQFPVGSRLCRESGDGLQTRQSTGCPTEQWLMRRLVPNVVVLRVKVCHSTCTGTLCGTLWLSAACKTCAWMCTSSWTLSSPLPGYLHCCPSVLDLHSPDLSQTHLSLLHTSPFYPR